jgi:hypothetical protein
MVNIFYPIKDATIYESNPDANTGMDSILELQHTSAGNRYRNSRILIKFDQSEINEFLAEYNVDSPVYTLNLYTARIEESPIEVSIETLAVSGSWENGTGNTNDNITIKNGTSWRWMDFFDSMEWVRPGLDTNSFSFSSVSGGGTWHTESLYKSTNSIANVKNDLNIDVTEIFTAFTSGTLSNDGLILKLDSQSETSNYPFYSYKFFSNESNTIYSPKLKIIWDDSSYVTGSLSLLDTSQEFVIYSRIKEVYNQDEKTKIRIFARPKFIERTYATQSQHLINYRLPSSSYYEIRDTVTDDIIIPFDEIGTKLSCDETSNYFNMFMNNFQPERFYKILIKVKIDAFEQYVIDDGIYFKVAR